MPETQTGKLLCPECRAPIDAVFQQLTAWSYLSGNDANVELIGSKVSLDSVSFEYSGESDVLWDSQIDHPDQLVKCDNGHIVKISDCTFAPTDPETFPFAEARVTRTLYWRSEEYLAYCKESGETPTGEGFASYVRFDMEGSGNFPGDDVRNFSVELIRRPDS